MAGEPARPLRGPMSGSQHPDWAAELTCAPTHTHIYTIKKKQILSGGGSLSAKLSGIICSEF